MNTQIANGAYTIESPKGGHRTFEIKTVLADPKQNSTSFRNKFAGARIIGLLTGPDNTSNYTRFGWVNEDGIAVFKDKRRASEDAPFTDWEFYAAMVWSMATEGERSGYYERGYRMHLEKRCIRCNRRLTTPQSIEAGIGPECAGRV